MVEGQACEGTRAAELRVDFVRKYLYVSDTQIGTGLHQVTGIADKIMRSMRAHGRGNWVCTPKDFLDLGSRAAVDQALSRLVKTDKLRRVGRGLYDLPRMSTILNRPAPTNLDAAINALARRDGIRIMPNGIIAANKLGLTNAVPAKADYVTDGATKTVKIGSRTVRFRRAGPSVMIWADRPAAPVVQALRWLGPHAASDSKTVSTLQRYLPDDVKEDLAKGMRYLPPWAVPIVGKIIDGQRTAA